MLPEAPDAQPVSYRTSTFSAGGECVAVAWLSADRIAVRHSKRDAPPIVFDRPCWQRFLASMRSGEFSEPGA